MKFTRQFPIEWKVDSEKSNFFIVDFHCHQYKLVIELDGKYHNKEEVKLRDRERSEILRGMGYNIIRFKNEVCLLYTSPSPRDRTRSRMPSSA